MLSCSDHRLLFISQESGSRYAHLLVLERRVLDLVLALGGVNMLPAASEVERVEAEAALCRYGWED